MAKIAVAGKWETGWSVPITEAPQWAFPLRDFAVDEWYMHPVTGIRHSEEQNMPVIEKPSIEDIFAATEGMTRVYVEPGRGENIETFVHPENALYIFGGVAYDPATHMREGDKALYIPTIENKGMLWPHQVLVLVLYDRLLKNGAWAARES